MILFDTPASFDEAIAAATQRGLLPSSLGSHELRQLLGREVRSAAVFSAKVENARFLGRVRDVTERLIRNVTPASQALADAGREPLLLDRAGAKQELLDAVRELGLGSTDPDKVGTIQDLASDRRLSLIVRTQEEVALGRGEWMKAQDPILLDLYPAWELVRISDPVDPKHRRDWASRWLRVGGGTFAGRMIALKNDPIWDAIGNPAVFDDGLGNPYPPFAFNSGMGVENVSRDEAIELGLITEATPSPTPADPREHGMNPTATADQFESAFAGVFRDDPDLELVGSVLKLRGRP